MAAPPPRRAGSPAPAQPEGAPLLSILVKQKVLSPEQADRAHRATRVGGASPAQAVIQLGLANEAQIAKALATHCGLEYVSINPLDLDLDVVTRALPGPFARKHGLVALSKSGNRITVAVHDPFAPFPQEDIERVTGLHVVRVVATRSDVERINKTFYDLQTSLKSAEKQLAGGRLSSMDIGNQEFLSASAEELDPAAAPVVKALDHILAYAFEQRASDIHFEPKRDLTLVRLRIDGILHDVHLIPKIVYKAVVSRIKLLSGCDLAEKRRPQDGRIKTWRADREVELRVASLATAHGEKVVIRVFDPSVLMTDLRDLGMSREDRERFERWITSPSGLVLVTGPTGSGKTTTLYSTLRYLSGPEVNITTVEDPIEMVDARFCQVQVQRQVDVSFASALRAILRQDPDVIMVGEIRDGETAQMAVQAALTGHLVFSTVHTRDAAGAITRLVELGVERFLLGSVLRGVLAQRLLRKICPHCGVDGLLSPAQVDALGIKVPVERSSALKARWGEGCPECRHTGLYGRSGVFEMLDVGRRVRALITEGKDANEITHAARVEGMETLREAAIRKLADGTTTFEEVVRLTAEAL